jgi:hypothetical protein
MLEYFWLFKAEENSNVLPLIHHSLYKGYGGLPVSRDLIKQKFCVAEL